MNGDLRFKFKNKRKAFIGEERKQADRKILKNFLAAYSEHQSFLIYNSFGAEADTSGIVAALLSLNKQIYLPRVENEALVAVRFGKTQKGAFGIFEPVGKPYFGEIDITVTPLLAINGKGYRLGYGGGFYDRYLKDKNTLRVGLGYAFQLTDEFCEREWDERLNCFVSEKGIINFI